MNAAKRFIHKAVHHLHHQRDGGSNGLTSADVDFQIGIHYGIPSTASLLAFDPVQRLLAVATLDGRIKVLGGDGIEGLLVSEKPLPYKNIEFLCNEGFLVGISNEDEIQVWNLESRSLACYLQWESIITTFSVIGGSYFMCIGDEHGLMSVVKFDAEVNKLVRLPYHIPASSLQEAAGFASSDLQTIVGILPQPCSNGNRVLIAYENGLIILWDISEAKILFVGGGKDLQLKDGNVDSQCEVSNALDDSSHHYPQEKEISALCWASPDGSILAVGYIDGDIVFWKTPPASSSGGWRNENSSNNVVKVQLSSTERRLPVIVLHWSTSNRSSNECNGQLFIYGGDEVGSEEALTVLTLEWSSGMETLKCTGRLDLILASSFADMILLPRVRPVGGNDKVSLFVLTNPGQLHLYDDASISSLPSQRERKTSVFAMEYPAVVPVVDPPMTVAKFVALPIGGNSSRHLYEISSVKKNGGAPVQAGAIKWPLTGGVPNQLSFAEHTGFERIYIAGYRDGSIRLWDATYSVLSLICVLKGEAEGIKVTGFGASVSSLDFCSITSSLAVGNECGLVHIYDLNSSSNEINFRVVTETKNEDHNLPKGKGPHFRAVFSLLNSPIHALNFSDSGIKLAVGFGSGHVAVLDMKSVSTLFLTDCVSATRSPIISLIWIHDANIFSFMKSSKNSKNNVQANHAEELIFVLTEDATFNIINGDSGSMISSHPWRPKKKSIALSMYVVECGSSVSGIMEKQPEPLAQDAAAENESMRLSVPARIDSNDSEDHSSPLVASNGERFMDSFVLLCFKDSLRLYSTKNMIQGNNKSICKVKHTNPCCFVSTLKKDDKVYGLALLFQTGIVEIRSFPDLELVKENSLMSILRWRNEMNIEKMIYSSDNGQIIMANGSELAFISLLSSESYFKIPESFPCLHDKVLAAAAESAFSVSSNQKKKQVTNSGILGNIIKGFKGGKVNHTVDSILTPKSNFTHLEGVFSTSPFSDALATDNATDNHEAVEIDIDDIEIDEPPLPTETTISQGSKQNKRGKGTEREQLLGVADGAEPRRRTPEEIIAKYRKAGDASSVAAQTRNKLAERQEKLDRISKRTAELQSGAEDFASMANELVKVMENRKWYQI